MSKLTSAELIIKPIQAIEETTEGQPPATGTPFVIGVNSMISLKRNGQWVEVPQLSEEDLVGFVQGPQKYPVQIKYNPVDSTFAKYGANAADYGTPAGTISASLTIIFSMYINGTEKYIVISGVRPDQIQFDFNIGKPIDITVDCASMVIQEPSASAPAGLTLATTPAVGPIWDWLSGGASPISDGGTGQNIKKFSVTIKRNVKEEYTLGAKDPFATLSHGRRIAISGDVLYDGTSTFEDDQKTKTLKTMIITLKTTTSTLTLSNRGISDYTRNADISTSDAIVENITGKATAAALT